MSGHRTNTRVVIQLSMATLLPAVLIAVLVVTGFLPAAPRAQAQDRLHVVASFSILADVVHNVAGDAAEVESLIPYGANPHSFEPSAQDVVTLSDADVIFMLGMNFEEGLQGVVQEAATGTVYELWNCLPIRSAAEAFSGIDDHDHAADEDHGEDEDAHAGETDDLCTDHTAAVQTAFGLDTLMLPGAVTHDDPHYFEVLAEVDPHVWTDPVNVALWTLMIRDMLSAEDPVNADIYAANADTYLTELAALYTEVNTLIETIPSENRVIVTNHLAFNYFAQRYGLELVGVVIPGGSTSAEPSVQDVLNLITTIQEKGVPAIFTETTVSDSLAQQIADESGAQIVSLYTGSLSKSNGPAATYIDYTRFNATQIAEALR